jgi:hypothetical protein
MWTEDCPSLVNQANPLDKDGRPLVDNKAFIAAKEILTRLKEKKKG